MGIVSLRKTTSTLDFQAWDMRFGRLSFCGVRILGSSLLLSSSPELFNALFEQLAASFTDFEVIEVRGLPTSSALWAYLNECDPLQREFTLYAPDGPRWCHTIDVPESYEDYLSGFKRKKRYNLVRQVRSLVQWSDGSLALCRVQTASEVPLLLNALGTLGALGLQKECPISGLDETEILDLARRGLLLSYVLNIRERPYAIAIGTVFMGTLLIHGFAHDRQLDRLSPGTVLDTLLMRDLIENKLAHRIDYGFGEPKYRLTNNLDQRITVFLVRKNMRNRLAIMAHTSFVRLLNWIKSLVLLNRRL